MEEAPENGKELLHSAHANGMNNYKKWQYLLFSMRLLIILASHKQYISQTIYFHVHIKI